MRRCAFGEAELNNARLLPRAPPSALHIEFCISPVGAVSRLSLVVCREMDSAHLTWFLHVQMDAAVEKKQKLTGGPDGP